jgi:O-antigen/teichoic acid export membrane protein
LKLDVLTSYLLRLINILLRFILIPVYIHYLGIGAFGLIGFYASIEASMVFFDFGMGVASNKLLAEESDENPIKVSRILNTVEAIYWVVSLLIGVSIILAADIIANTWLTITNNDIDGVMIVKLMGVLFIFSWPKSLYIGFLSGKKKFFLQNKLQIIVLLLQGTLLYFGIAKIQSSIEMYFYILITIMILDVFLLRFYGIKVFPRKDGFAKFHEIKSFFKYSSGLAVLSVLSLFAFQFDKLYISKFFSVEDLGTYSLAIVLPFAILTLVYPITSTSFPRIINIKINKSNQKTFQDWSLVIFLIIVSISIILYCNTSVIFDLWLNKPLPIVIELAQVLLLGIFFHTSTNMIYNLLIANGKSKIVTVVYLVSLVVYIFSYFYSGQNELIIMAYSWVYFNISLFLGLALSLYYFKKEIAYTYFKNYIKTISIGFLMAYILHSIFLLDYLQDLLILKLISYIALFGYSSLYYLKTMKLI